MSSCFHRGFKLLVLILLTAAVSLSAVQHHRRDRTPIYPPDTTKLPPPPPPSGPVIYGAPSGSPTGSGTKTDPLDLRGAIARVRPDTAVELLGGIYRVPTAGLARTAWIVNMGNPTAAARSLALGGKKSVIRATAGQRVIITRDNSYPPYIVMQAFTRLENVWMGGVKDTSANGGVITVAHDIEMAGCAMFGYYGGVCDAESLNVYTNNLFADCGTGTLFHSIYFSGFPVNPNNGSIAQQNVFLGGGAYHMHLWHKPQGIKLLNNFSGDAWYGMVIDGNGILSRDNILWSNRGQPVLFQGDQYTTARVNHNLIGKSVTYYNFTTTQGLTADSNAFVTGGTQWHPFGTHQLAYTGTDVATRLGATSAAIDNAIGGIERSFAAGLTAVLNDTTIPGNWTLLRGAAASWAASAGMARTGASDDEADPDEPAAPQDFTLGQNYPNPFNPSTSVTFSIPAADHVTLTVYDVLGREVARLADEVMSSGAHTIRWQPVGLSSGVYLYRLAAAGHTLVRKMVFNK